MIKALNFSELDVFASELRLWVGAQLQEINGSAREIGMRFFKNSRSIWLWIELNPQAPLPLILDRLPPRHRKKIKPLHLFLRSNCVGRKLIDVIVSEESGRVLKIVFDRDASAEFRLFPHGQNAIVHCESKSIAWSKPKELPPGGPIESRECRNLSEMYGLWVEQRLAQSQGSKSSTDSTEKVLRRERAKKQKAIDKIELDIALEKETLWRKFGDWLKSGGGDALGEFVALYDTDKSDAWNIENSFTQAKKIEKKRSAQLLRLKILKNELLTGVETKNLTSKDKNKVSLLAKAGARGRRRVLASGREVVFGRSGKDNLAILRAAKAWEFWLHLRDFPGAYAIISSKRNEKVSDSEFKDAALWLASEQKGKHFSNGDIFEVIVAECRFVRPVKGDRVGRTTYKNERILRIKFEKS